MPLNSWRSIATPHDDVLRGQFKQAELAADLFAVHKGKSTPEYQDPSLFYHRTFITEGMRLLLDSVVKRLAGIDGEPVIRLQTAFGGGKTHSMLAVYHLATGKVPSSQMPGIPAILDKAGILDLPRAKVVVLDGCDLSPSIPRVHGKVEVNTLWGELAWQLGGAEAYKRVAAADQSGTSPGKEVLATLIQEHSPCVILVDELVRYISQFEEGRSHKSGTFDSNLSFIQSLTEALKQTPRALMLASLPESDKETGSERGIKTLHTLEHFYGRVQAIWKPVSTEEAFAIVRKRLFKEIADPAVLDKVCQAYHDLYIANPAAFPAETQESRYLARLRQAYPIHPEFFDRLYEDWSTNTDFQRTRGVLKLMAKVIHRLWKEGNKDALIMPGSLPLDDSDTRTEAIAYLPQGWDPVVEGDIDGERSEARDIEMADGRLGALQACRRTARTIFLGSAAAVNTVAKGVTRDRIFLGCISPGETIAIYEDALKRISDRLHFLNVNNGRYWFGTTPNLRREMESRKQRFDNLAELQPEIEKTLRRMLGVPACMKGVHIGAGAGDIRDDEDLRLVVLSPLGTYSKQVDTNGYGTEAFRILQSRGAAPRLNQNRLIFLAPDHENFNLRLRENVRTLLAWQSIVDDSDARRLNLDGHMQDTAKRELATSRTAMERAIRDTYKWLVVPAQEVGAGKVGAALLEVHAIRTDGSSMAAEIERTLKEEDLVVSEWSPIHLDKLLSAWIWKDGVVEIKARDLWQHCCRYLYFPRLAHGDVLRLAIEKGAPSRDYYGTAHGKEGEDYRGFGYGKANSAYLDDSMLLIEPAAAAAYERRKTPAAPPPDGTLTDPAIPVTEGKSMLYGVPPPVTTTKVATLDKHFWARKKLNSTTAKVEFNDIFEEIITHLNLDPDADVTVEISIEATHAKGFPTQTRRTVSENSKTLKMDDTGFGAG